MWLITRAGFANSLDPDQARQNVLSDLDANWLTSGGGGVTTCDTLVVFLNQFLELVDFEKCQQKIKLMKLPSRQWVNSDPRLVLFVLFQ